MSPTCDQVSKKLDSLALCWKSTGTAVDVLKNKKQIQKGAEQDGVAQSGEGAGETVQTFGTHLALIIAYTELKVLKAMSVPSSVIIILRITESTGFVLVFL